MPEGAPGRVARLLHDGALVIALDEAGESLPSRAFAGLLDGRAHVQILIGGADGHAPEVRKRAQRLVAFGAQTWPHKLVRVMALEQLYRAQQIIAGHPYHRG